MTMLDAEGTYATCACNNLERFNTVGVVGASTEVAEEVPDFGPFRLSVLHENHCFRFCLMSYVVGKEQRTVEEWQVNWVGFITIQWRPRWSGDSRTILDVKETLLRIDCSSETRNHL